jgi:hypothetical protein
MELAVYESRVAGIWVWRWPEKRARVALGSSEICGKKSARLMPAMANASSRRATADCSVGLACSDWSSSVSSAGSWKIFHQAPFGRASLGVATFHGPVSLNAAGAAVSGFL